MFSNLQLSSTKLEKRIEKRIIEKSNYERKTLSDFQLKTSLSLLTLLGKNTLTKPFFSQKFFSFPSLFLLIIITTCLTISDVATFSSLVRFSSAQSVSYGYPYVILTIRLNTGVPASSFNPETFRRVIGEWVQQNEAGRGFKDLKIPDEIELHEISTPTSSAPFDMKITLSPTYPNGVMYLALEDLNNGPIRSLFGADFVYVSSTLVENPSISSAIYFDPYGSQYVGTWTRKLEMKLSFSPKRNKKVVVALESKTPDVTISPYPLVVSWPDTSFKFQMTSNVTGVKTFKRSVLYPNTTDDSGRYDFYVDNPSLTVLPLERIEIYPPDPSIKNYENTSSGNFYISVPNSYRDARLNLIVTVRSSPQSLQIFKSNVSVTKRGVNYSFHVVGAVGTYTLTYYIAPPWNRYSQNNDYFTQPTVSHTISFIPLLSLTVDDIADGYMISPPVSATFGGAFSFPVKITLQASPKVSLAVSVSGPDCEIIPPVVTFLPNETVKAFIVRGLRTGRKAITFKLGNRSAGDYAPPGAKEYVVHGRNPTCGTKSTAASCFDTNGCLWDAAKSGCFNTHIPINFLGGRLPTVYDGERTRAITLSLATPVRTSLNITFTLPSSRIEIVPPVLALSQGESTANFSIIGRLKEHDRVMNLSFGLVLSGANANDYAQGSVSVILRPKVSCFITPPLAFFVGTVSDNFTVDCDESPEIEIFLTPVPQQGLEFVPVGPHVGGAMYLGANQTGGKFVANSTSDHGPVGTYKVSLLIRGANAARYKPIPSTEITVFPKAAVSVIPPFSITQYDGLVIGGAGNPMSRRKFHLDLSFPPRRENIQLTVRIFDPATGGEVTPGQNSVRILPSSTVTYKPGQREAEVMISSVLAGNFTLNFTLVGPERANYVEDSSIPSTRFQVLPMTDGNTWLVKQRLGFIPRTVCRVNVGRNSRDFVGELEPDLGGRICDALPELSSLDANGTTECPKQPTEDLCLTFMSLTGNICYWIFGSCKYISEIQGEVMDFAYGNRYIVFVTKNNSVYTIGEASESPLGHKQVGKLARVFINDTIISVVTGDLFTLALSDTGNVYSWGMNNVGQLGINSLIRRSDRVYKIPFPKYESMTCVSAGISHAAAVSSSGRLYTWGSNSNGQLGDKQTYKGYNRMWKVVKLDQSFGGDPVTGVQCGEKHTVVATSTSAYTFGFSGSDGLGRIGFDEYTPRKPVPWGGSRYTTPPKYRTIITGNVC